MFLLILMFELLRESGTKASAAIGSAISIVGALIIGDAAVSAGIVSAPVVIIVALARRRLRLRQHHLNEFITIYRLLFLLLGEWMGLIAYRFRLFVPACTGGVRGVFGVPYSIRFHRRGGGTARSVFRFGR